MGKLVLGWMPINPLYRAEMTYARRKKQGKGMIHLAHISHKGPVKYGQLPGSIGVHDALDNPMPIGMALCRGWDENGFAVWTLTVHGEVLPGRWVIIDKRFVPAQ
jgi:hypothetical protein